MVFGAIHFYNKTKKFKTLGRKHRARKTIPAEYTVICRTSKKKNPFLSSCGIKTEIGQNINSKIFTRTIRRRLQESRLRRCMAHKNSMSQQKNIKERLQIATEMLKKDACFGAKFSGVTKLSLICPNFMENVYKPSSKQNP